VKSWDQIIEEFMAEEELMVDKAYRGVYRRRTGSTDPQGVAQEEAGGVALPSHPSDQVSLPQAQLENRRGKPSHGTCPVVGCKNQAFRIVRLNIFGATIADVPLCNYHRNIYLELHNRL
jgi:hypothetical protein